MKREEFISWIMELGFTKTYGDNEEEYSMFIGDVSFIGQKLYFTLSETNTRIHYSNTNDKMSYGSTLGHFMFSDIGEFEKTMIIIALMKHFNEIPIPVGFKKYLRDSKIKNILDD